MNKKECFCFLLFKGNKWALKVLLLPNDSPRTLLEIVTHSIHQLLLLFASGYNNNLPHSHIGRRKSAYFSFSFFCGVICQTELSVLICPEKNRRHSCTIGAIWADLRLSGKSRTTL